MRACALSLILSALGVLAGGCDSESDRRPLSVLIPSVGHVVTKEFEIPRAWHYSVYIGLDLVPTDEATCRAAIPAGVSLENLSSADRHCAALAPPMGAIDWVLTQSGKVVASDSAPAYSWQWPGSHSTAVHWRRVGDIWKAEPGSHYLLQLTIHAPPLPVKGSQAHLQLLAPLK